MTNPVLWGLLPFSAFQAAGARPSVGDEGQQAVPAARGRGGRRGGAPLGWKERSKIQFMFKPDFD